MIFQHRLFRPLPPPLRRKWAAPPGTVAQAIRVSPSSRSIFLGAHMPSYTSIVKAAVVQAEPVWLKADETISKSIGLIEQASRAGADIIAFPEVFIPGYPWWIWLDDQ